MAIPLSLSSEIPTSLLDQVLCTNNTEPLRKALDVDPGKSAKDRLALQLIRYNIFHNRIEYLTKLIQAGLFKVNAERTYSYKGKAWRSTPLSIACSYNQTELMEILVRHHAPVTADVEKAAKEANILEQLNKFRTLSPESAKSS